MQPRVKFGLIVGLIGLVLNTCVAFAVGICGPVTALIAGAVAGFLTARAEAVPTQGDSAKAGAISGAIAGALVFLGQLCGAIGRILVDLNRATTALGNLPRVGEANGVFISLAIGLGTGMCLGLLGVGLAAGAGALIAYITTPSRPVVPPASPVVQG